MEARGQVNAVTVLPRRKRMQYPINSSTLFLTSVLEGGEGSTSRLGRTLLPGKTRYPLYKRLGGPQGRSGLVRKISPLPGFDPRTVQPVGSRYTDYATRPTDRRLNMT